MGLNLSGVARILGIGLLLGLLSACGGGSGGGDSFTGGGFVGREEIKVNVSASRTSLPPNIRVQRPDFIPPIGDPRLPFGDPVPFPSPATDPYTTVITVRVTQEDRLFLLPEESVLTLAITDGLEHGGLVCPEIEGEEGPCTDYEDVVIGVDENGEPIEESRPVGQFRYRGVASDLEDGPEVGLNSGVFQFYFTAEGDPDGRVVITASVLDINTNQTVSDTVTINILPGTSTGNPAQITFTPQVPEPLYITGQGLRDTTTFQVNVFDPAFEPVPNSGNRNNLLLQILPNSPDGGEFLTAVGGDGVSRSGDTVATQTRNGIATVNFTSGQLPGTVLISATADRADNDVDNGIQDAVTDIYQISISNGQVRSLTFTGPFVELINERDNVLTQSPAGQVGTPILDEDGNVIGFVEDNVYTIQLTVLAVDQFGNPPPPNTQITFRVVDSPLEGFPDEGRGVFTISGDDGNIQEGGVLFTTPPGGSTFAGAQPSCQLVYEGLPPDQEGGRIIQSVDTLRQLSVNTPFNPAPDTGFTVPWVVGCPPHAGSVGQIGSGRAVAFTNEEGLATIDLIYDATQLGRRFKVVAEAAGGQAGAVLSYWYLGVGTAVLSLLDENGELIFESPDTLEVLVAPGATVRDDFIARLTDSNGLPLPVQLLSIDALIFDPDVARVLELTQELTLAETALAVAEGNLATFEENAESACGVVDGPVPGDACPVPQADPPPPADPPADPPPPVEPIDGLPSELDCELVGADDGDNGDAQEGEFLLTENSLLGEACSLETAQSPFFTCSNGDACTAALQELQDAVIVAQQAVSAAEAELATAQALDDEFDPTVSVNVGNGLVELPTNEGPVTIQTGANGEAAPIEIVVSDLPPQRVIDVDENGVQTLGEIPRVSVFITTVGPDPQAPAIQIDFQTAADPATDDDGADDGG